MLPWTHAPDPCPKGYRYRFSRFCTANTLQWFAPFPSKLPLRIWDLDLRLGLIHGSLCPPSPQPKRHLRRFSRFTGLTIVTDRPTDGRDHVRFCSNRPHTQYILDPFVECISVMQCRVVHGFTFLDPRPNPTQPAFVDGKSWIFKIQYPAIVKFVFSNLRWAEAERLITAEEKTASELQ